jgi:hypothetical protein
MAPTLCSGGGITRQAKTCNAEATASQRTGSTVTRSPSA